MGSRYTVRWGDLLSPRAMYDFTIGDAWGALPTLLAMGGLFLLAVLIIFVIKKLAEWLLLCRQQRKKFVVVNRKNAGVEGKVIRVWRPFSRGYYGSIVHVVLETLFFVALIIAAFFAAAAGNVNIWESPVALSIITVVVTYIFGGPLQNVGNGWGVFISNSMVYGEYWRLEGAGIEGFVSYISPFFVELERIDKVSGGILIHRVTMTTVFNGNWTRDINKEKYEVHPSRDTPPGSTPTEEVDEEEDVNTVPAGTGTKIAEFIAYVRNEKEHVF